MTEILESTLALAAFLTATVVVPLAAAALIKVIKKTGIEIDNQYEAMLRQKIQDVALRVEEMAAARIKRGETSASSSAKLDVVLDETESYVRESVPPEMRERFLNQLTQMVHEELPKAGIGALASK